MSRLVIVLLRVMLIVLLLGAVLAQVLVPIAASEIGVLYPEVEHLVVPYSVAAILAIACAEVVLVVIWRLLSLVADGMIFSVGSLRWVDAIVVAIGVATVLSAGVLVHLVGVAQVGGPGVALTLLGTVAAGIALALLMVVMRGLLRSAAHDRGELDGVI
ncbi:hypothetical protein EDD28_0448 [Salana multivorans]|uniref:DUF2975 family protein n=1 Tax=Salana multivorans TaxID=120377 RepID=A0A3N2D8V3_9MICO|nr:DUF2975 domain-containing protein [Salana multivorans]ROR95884.1 hypothetical protein EDD28_0448 [Salana multivorans]